MSQAIDETPIVPPAPEPIAPARNRASDEMQTRSPRGSGAAALAVVLALLAAAGAGYAAWRVMLIERGGDNALSDVRQRLDAIDARLTENERRAARNNELAATLRDQLTENERLRDRMREDLLALGERSARAESLLADLARDQRGAREQLAVADAALMLAQADARLRLFGDRPGALGALDLAERALAQSGSDQADLRSAVADARAALAADARPSTSALLAELDAIDDAVDAIGLRGDTGAPDGSSATTAANAGWWTRQFARLDHLVTIRREGDEDSTGPTRDGVRLSLARARLAAIEQDMAALPPALASARASLVGCCDATASAPLLARLDRLIAVRWQAPLPDVGALRQRLDDRAVIERLPGSTPESLPAPAPPSPGANAPRPAEETT